MKAGGAATNRTGLRFEHRMRDDDNLIRLGFRPFKGGLAKTSGDTQYMYLKKDAFCKFCATELGVVPPVKKRKPDGVYIRIKGNTVEIKILEMKNQTVSGSVDLKLYAGTGIRHEYRHWLKTSKYDVTVDYAFCICNYLKEECYDKIPTMASYLEGENIPVMFGECDTYFETLHEWAFGNENFIDA
jgi:hypothetical protein